MKITKKQFDGFIFTKEDAIYYISDASEVLDSENVNLLAHRARNMLPFENMPKVSDMDESTMKINKMLFLMGMDHAFGIVMESQKEWAKKQKITI